MLRTSVMTVSEMRGQPRIYIQGKYLGKLGFPPGEAIAIRYVRGGISIKAGTGERRVSHKSAGSVPVIDFYGDEIHTALGRAGQAQVRVAPGEISITPAYTVLLLESRVLAPTEASLFSGGGFLSLAAKLAGFAPRLAVEANSQYADIYSANHPQAHLFNCSVEQVPWRTLERFRPIGVMTMGIPCEAFTQIRRLDRGGQTKRDKQLPPEAHESGDMVFWGLRGVEALNPHTLVIEEVPKFLDSGAGHILLHALKRLYRHVEARVLNPLDFGCLTARQRAAIIASDNPIIWPAEFKSTATLGSLFDPEPHEWFDESEKQWLFEHWRRQAAKGNGFANGLRFDAASPAIGTIKKRYFAGQGDNPVIAHPDGRRYRWLTVNEVKRLHGVPQDYYLGDAKTLAGEVLGQGVVVNLFEQLIRSVTGRNNP